MTPNGGRDGGKVIKTVPSALSGEASSKLVKDAAGAGAAKVDSPQPPASKMKTMRGKQYYQATLTEPPLYFTPIGRRWSLDIVAVANNSVRAELNDMYYIVQSMLKRRYDLSHDDLDDFYLWFEVFNFFLQGIFELQDQAVFQLVDKRIKLESTLSPEGRREFRNLVTTELRKIDQYQPRFQLRPPGEVLPTLVSFIDAVVPRIIRYFKVMEKYVPPLIEEKFAMDDKAVFDNLTMRLIAGQQDPHWFFILYLRGEPRKKVRKDMRLTFFRLRNILVRYAWKRSYVRMKARVKDVHFDVVKEFWRRWREAKLEVDEAEAQAEQELFAAGNVQRDVVRQLLEIEESDEEDDYDYDTDEDEDDTDEDDDDDEQEYEDDDEADDDDDDEVDDYGKPLAIRNVAATTPTPQRQDVRAKGSASRARTAKKLPKK